MCNPPTCINFAASLTPTHTEWHLLDRISILELLVVVFRFLVWIWEAGRAEQILLGRLSKWLQWRNRLAHGTYRQYIEKCRGCEFEPHLEQYDFIKEKSGSKYLNRPWQDSNLQSPDPKSGALSIRPHGLPWCSNQSGLGRHIHISRGNAMQS